MLSTQFVFVCRFHIIPPDIIILSENCKRVVIEPRLSCRTKIRVEIFCCFSINPSLCVHSKSDLKSRREKKKSNQTNGNRLSCELVQQFWINFLNFVRISYLVTRNIFFSKRLARRVKMISVGEFYFPFLLCLCRMYKPFNIGKW